MRVRKAHRFVEIVRAALSATYNFLRYQKRRQPHSSTVSESWGLLRD
jgi:hypothetical protein